jgi:acyl-coenzyme A thioesterase PaaI-like protein
MEWQAPPEGFSRHFRSSPVTDSWEPLFSRRGEKAVQLGVWVRQSHCNSRGILHGGVMTVSLTIDYLAAAKIGQWLLIDPRVVKTGKTLGFADAMITADGDVVARANAAFRMLP